MCTEEGQIYFLDDGMRVAEKKNCTHSYVFALDSFSPLVLNIS